MLRELFKNGPILSRTFFILVFNFKVLVLQPEKKNTIQWKAAHNL